MRSLYHIAVPDSIYYRRPVKPRFVRPRIADLLVAILTAAVAAALYRTCVFSQFEPIRTDVVSTKLQSSGHVVSVALPDLSNVRGQTAELGVRLQNTLLVPRRIGVLRAGFPPEPIVLPPSGAISWDILLPSEVVRALDAEVGEGARTLEFTGDADGWAVTAVEIRNYHARVGDPLKLVVLAKGPGSHTPGTGFLSITLLVCVLAIVNALEPKPARTSLRLVVNGLAFSAFLLSLVCLLLPAFSAHRVLLSPFTFLLLAAGLFAPGVLHAGARWVAGTNVALAARYWKRHELTFERGAMVFGLSAIAIAQPVFEVVSNSPEFFAARGTTAATVLAAVVAICAGVPAVLLGIERAIRTVSPRAATAFYGLTLAVLSAAILMPIVQRSSRFAPPWDGLAAGLGAVAVALAARSRIVRQFLTALAPAALVVPVLFVFDPGVRQNFLPSESAAGVQTIDRTPPIVFVIFDELPLTSLLDAEGNIDAARFPNFAALAGDAFWFRNASTVASNTEHAVPAILSGRYPTSPNAVPTLRYYPVNLFTTLAQHYEIQASLRFQQLCPPRVCQADAGMAGDTVESLVSDLGLVWMHIVLPRTFAEGLPPVTEDWAEFGRPRQTRTGEGQYGRGGVFAEFVSAIDGRPARLHFIHSMVPHMPFEYVPSGRRYRRPENENQVFRRNRMFEGASAAYTDVLHQRHLAQAGFVDRLVGELVSRLREVGAYDKALVVITSDHGASYREGRSRRQPQEHRNLSDILSVPLFVRFPGQQRGEVVDRIVEAVDILPTILDVVGAHASLRFDGRSLVDGRAPARSTRTFVWRNRSNAELRTIGDLSAERAGSLGRRERRFTPGDPEALYAPPEARHLLGATVGRAPMHAAQDVRVSIRNERQFQAVNVARDPLPLYVSGVLSTSRSEPLTVAVAVNGVVAAVTRSYRERDTHMFATLIPETSLRNGDNAVTAVVVDTPSR